MTDTRNLLSGLKEYKESLNKHLSTLRCQYQQLKNQWRTFNAASEGDYANQFRTGWSKTDAQFQQYIQHSEKIKAMLEERIEALEKFNSATIANNFSASLIAPSSNANAGSNYLTEAAEATVNYSINYRHFTEKERAELLLRIAMENGTRAEPREGKGFEKFYVKNKLDRVKYQEQFHHNPEQELRRADSFAFLEKDGEEIISLVEIMRSGKQFKGTRGGKLEQTKIYGNTVGHSLVLGKPAKLKYVFWEEPTPKQLMKLQTALKQGIQEAVEKRFNELVEAGEPPSNLTKKVNLDIEIEVWN